MLKIFLSGGLDRILVDWVFAYYWKTIIQLHQLTVTAISRRKVGSLGDFRRKKTSPYYHKPIHFDGKNSFGDKRGEKK